MSHPIARIMGLSGPTAQAPAPAVTNIIPLPAAPMATKYLPYNPDGITQAIRDHPHWLVADCTGRPVARPGVGNSKTNPDHWTDFATASRIAESEPGLWPYIVLTDDSPFTILDVDYKPQVTVGKKLETDHEYLERLCRADTAHGKLQKRCPERYESISKSGRGRHIIVLGKFVGPGAKGKNEWADVEIYTKGHGIALTGHVWQGHDHPATYPAEMLQDLRDTIKGGAPIAESGEDAPERRSNGNVRPEWARQVLAKIAADDPRPERGKWLKVSSAMFEGVGVDLGIELLMEVWPEEKRGEYRTLARTLPKFISWGTLRSYGVNPDDSENLVDFMPLLRDEGGQAKPTRKRLADYLVNHSDTLGMSWREIDALRPPFIIDGFLRWGEVLLLGAESKSRKSWLTQDAGFAVAAGLPWLADVSGAHGFATAQARVHVFDLELNPEEMRYRFAKARGNRFAESPKDAAAMTARIAAYSFDGQNVTEIMQRLEELKATVAPGDLVIVDCLYRLCPDGNEVAEVAAILEAVKRFASETQAGVILVDHFRKAGDDKARNRFAGSFVKQASASTLVAIEVTATGVLVLNIDARTFHGCPKVHARFNSDTYAFNRLPEIEVEKAKQEEERGEAEGRLLRLWNGRPLDSAITAADAAARWGIKRQGAVPRLEKLVSRGWLNETKGGAGKATEWTLKPEGIAVLKPDTDEL